MNSYWLQRYRGESTVWFGRSFVMAPVAPDDSTPYRAQVRAGFGAFGGIENGYAQAIDRYRDFARKIRCQPKISERGSERRVEILGKKKALENLGLSECYQVCSLS